MNSWPDDFSFANDPLCQTRIKPFIETQIEKLRSLDEQRKSIHPEIEYIFSDHVKRVAADARNACLHLDLGENVAENMYWVALMHDIGKTSLPIEIWDVDDKPSPELKSLRRSHTKSGFDTVNQEFKDINHPFVELMSDVVLNHHEHIDGTGYLGKTGRELSMPVRLVAIVEAFDGGCVWRPHFGGRDISPAAVLDRMKNEKQGQFDPYLLNQFIAMKLVQ